MKSKSALAVLLIVVIGLVLARPGSAQNQERYKVRLSTVPMDGGMRETVAGAGTATATLAGTKLTFNGTFDGHETVVRSCAVSGTPAVSCLDAATN